MRMSWRSLAASGRIVQSTRRWRWIGVALLLSLALTACGASTSGNGQPTSKPSPTATPSPCTGWRIVSSPTNTKYPNSTLSAVSALSPSAAWAVGSTFTEGNTTNQIDSLIEQWDGSAWHIVASVNTNHGGLDAITAISPTDIWAAGGQFMHWDGTTWSVVPSVYPANAQSAGIAGIAAIASNDVWAVGSQQTSADSQRPVQLLVEHWNGAAWQIASSPPLPTSAAQNKGGYLRAVTRIPGTNQLWAVGEWHEWTNLGRGQPLIERWNGAAWQIVPTPALPTGALGGGWSGVVALSASNAWAVGSYAIKNPIDSHPLIAHWDGTRWQIVVANPDSYGELDSLAAGGATDVRAAGTLITGSGASSGNGQAVPLIEQWNGAAWQIAPTPELPSGALFQGLHIATDGAGNYWAVGSYLNAVGKDQYQTLPLILRCP